MAAANCSATVGNLHLAAANSRRDQNFRDEVVPPKGANEVHVLNALSLGTLLKCPDLHGP